MEKYLIRLVMADKLIRRRATGNPKELAKKLDVSESTVFRLLRIMKENMGLTIEWSARHNSYQYASGSEKFNLEKFILAAQE